MFVFACQTPGQKGDWGAARPLRYRPSEKKIVHTRKKFAKDL